jgi:two-component sensor histidine kinase
MPRNTQLFGPTFRGESIIRIADVLADARYGRNPPYRGMPEGHLPVRSYLAVPVLSPNAEVLGGLFFGHPEPGVFDERAEQAVTAVASQAALAVEKAHAYRAIEGHAKKLELAVDEKEVLLHEVHHRVKNNLQVILSMLQLEATRVDSSAKLTFQKVEARIRSIALVHQTLYEQPHAAGVDMAQYLRQLADSWAPLFAADGRSITLSANGAGELPLNLAVPVGLIASEVISNAGKHAFVGRSCGKIDIHFEVNNETAVLRISDDGVGFCERQISHGTGLRIISALAQQVNGGWSYGGQGGSVYELVLPASGSSSVAGSQSKNTHDIRAHGFT